MAGMGDTVNVTPTVDQAGNVIPVTATQTQPVDSREETWKQLTSEQKDEWAKKIAADQEVNAAAAPSAPIDTRTPEDITADVASQDQSAQPAKMLQENGIIPVPAGQPHANIPYSSQDFNASTEGAGLVGGIKGPQTIQQATDENSAYQAQAQARVARETEERQQAIEADRQHRVDAGMQRLNQASAEYEQKSKLTSYKEDHGMFHNILSALAVGMGAYGAAITHSPNFALEIINKEMDQDMERKKLDMESAFTKYKQAGMAPQQIEEWAKQQNTNLLAKQQAQLATIEKLGAKSLAPFPQAQQAFLQAAAERKANQAKVNLDFVKESTGYSKQASNIGEKQTSTTGQDVSKGLRALPTPAQSEEYIIAKKNAEHAGRLDELRKSGDLPTSDQLDEMMTRENKIIGRQAKEKESSAQAIFGDIARGVHVLPESIYPEGMTESQKEAARLQIELAHSVFVKRFTPGALQIPEAYQHGMAPIIGERGDSPQMVDQKVKDLTDLTRAKFDEMERVSKVGQAELRIPAINHEAKPAEGKGGYAADTAKQIIADEGTKGLGADDRAALKWAKEHPRDPQASAIQIKVAKKLAGVN